ncbi:iacI [Streptomyces viridochromogenes]|uniref:IacI n=1 Tax=Streptomyces viridochromogenes TaxID=1938 RepID=A0A0J7Z747_STRVR|nr:nuclear transport factor 2 family protein [Streptomyces viridochromogenes]KMS71332.1 iacI [Streptomyces viridochromogenes]KOG16614.1 iacI [Streptomyces viridochromogenes]KOG17320.1 iacI [Streptomyces viridochromogenes]
MPTHHDSAAAATARAVECLTRYLRLCDVPTPEKPDAVLAELAQLFTEDAVWEGIGGQYAEKFGRNEGRADVIRMLAGYLPPHDHFAANVHLLLPGTTECDGSVVRGNWLMQQLARYADGSSEILVARLDVVFRTGRAQAQISEFRTERLFSAPLGGEPMTRGTH